MRTVAIVLVVFSLSALGSGASFATENTQPGESVKSPVSTQRYDLISQLDFIPVGDLTEEEASELVYMREEEKLAYDLYVEFYATWGQRIFSNIAAAELNHMSAVLALLERYEITDPAASTASGVFNNMDLQDLYDYLLASGSSSFINALLAAAAVEEIDILDLETYLLDVEGNEDIVLVYENLLRGSRNHLRAFVRNLERQGVSYVPVYLEQEAYDLIIEASTDKKNKKGKRMKAKRKPN